MSGNMKQMTEITDELYVFACFCFPFWCQGPKRQDSPSVTAGLLSASVDSSCKLWRFDAQSAAWSAEHPDEVNSVKFTKKDPLGLDGSLFTFLGGEGERGA